MIFLVLMGIWTVCVAGQVLSFWDVLARRDYLKSARQYRPTMVSAVLSVFPMWVWALTVSLPINERATIRLANLIFAGRPWMHWVFVAIAGAQLVLALPALRVKPSEHVAGAVFLRVFGFLSACLAWFFVVMFFRSG
jgi:hypothetical protein